MKSIETREGQAESHFRVTTQMYEQAKEKFDAGPDRSVPHENPDFRSVRMQIRTDLAEASNNLNYAVDFAMPDTEAIKLLQSKIDTLKQSFRESEK